MKKKILCAVVAIAVLTAGIATFTGCGNGNDSENENDNVQPAVTTVTSEEFATAITVPYTNYAVTIASVYNEALVNEIKIEYDGTMIHQYINAVEADGVTLDTYFVKNSDGTYTEYFNDSNEEGWKSDAITAEDFNSSLIGVAQYSYSGDMKLEKFTYDETDKTYKLTKKTEEDEYGYVITFSDKKLVKFISSHTYEMGTYTVTLDYVYGGVSLTLPDGLPE